MIFPCIHPSPSPVFNLSQKSNTNHCDAFPSTRNLLFNVYELIQPGTPTVASMLFVSIFSYPVLSAIMPRFIISIREMYDRDRWNRWQGIDSGFGVCSQPSSSDSEDAVSPAAGLGDGVVSWVVARAVGDVDDSVCQV